MRRHLLLFRFTPRLVITAVAALVTGVVSMQLVGDAATARDRWGDIAVVAVAVADIPAGSVIGLGDVEMTERPASMLPAGALEELPVERTPRVDLVAGEVVVEDRLAGGASSGPSALIPPQWRAVAVSTRADGLPVEAGSVVDVVVTYDAFVTDADSGVVVADAVVIAVADEAVTVAVPASLTTAVADAVTNGVVTLALVS